MCREASACRHWPPPALPLPLDALLASDELLVCCGNWLPAARVHQGTVHRLRRQYCFAVLLLLRRQLPNPKETPQPSLFLLLSKLSRSSPTICLLRSRDDHAVRSHGERRRLRGRPGRRRAAPAGLRPPSAPRPPPPRRRLHRRVGHRGPLLHHHPRPRNEHRSCHDLLPLTHGCRSAPAARRCRGGRARG